jgi:hypothetical protein
MVARESRLLAPLPDESCEKELPQVRVRGGGDEATSSVGVGIRGGLETFFGVFALKDEVRGWKRVRLELP